MVKIEIFGRKENCFELTTKKGHRNFLPGKSKICVKKSKTLSDEIGNFSWPDPRPPDFKTGSTTPRFQNRIHDPSDFKPDWHRCALQILKYNTIQDWWKNKTLGSSSSFLFSISTLTMRLLQDPLQTSLFLVTSPILVRQTIFQHPTSQSHLQFLMLFSYYHRFCFSAFILCWDYQRSSSPKGLGDLKLQPD